MHLLLLPGYFGAAAASLLRGFERGGAFRGAGWRNGSGVGEPPADPASPTTWLLEVPEGAVRKSHGQARLAAGPSVVLDLEAYGASAGRVLFDLKVTLAKEGQGTWADLEIALLGLACAALGPEDQGAALLGDELHPTALLNPRGTVAEQVQRTVDFNAGAVRTLLLAPATAASLGTLADFVEDRLGTLVRWCRAAS